MKYFVSIGETVHEIDLGPDGARWAGEVHHVELATVPGTGLRHLRVGDRGYRLAARKADGIWHIETGPSELRAPRPGLIARVEVEPGQVVEAGAGLVVIEAMKMQNELRAPADGVVTSVEVEEGQTVDRGELLIRLEREAEA